MSDIKEFMLSKSTITCYDFWDLGDGKSLRYYYFHVVATQRRQFVIKRKNPAPDVPKVEVITQMHAERLANGIPEFRIRYWDYKKKHAVKISQTGHTAKVLTAPTLWQRVKLWIST